MLAGDLNEFTLPDLFQLLALTKKSGALRISHKGDEGRVCFADGEVYFAVADDRRMPLGARLVASGHLGADRLQALLRAHRGGSAVDVAASLQASGEIEEQTLERFLREQVHDALFRMLRLEEGGFTFDPTASVDWPGPRYDGAELLEEAHRRIDEWARLSAHMPDGSAVLSVVPNPPGESPLALDREQWHLVALVDGKRTVAQLVDLGGKGEFATGKLIGELVEAGLLEAHARAGEGALADLLAGRHALRQLEEVALGAVSTALSPPAAPATVSNGSRSSTPRDDESVRRLGRQRPSWDPADDGAVPSLTTDEVGEVAEAHEETDPSTDAADSVESVGPDEPAADATVATDTAAVASVEADTIAGEADVAAAESDAADHESNDSASTSLEETALPEAGSPEEVTAEKVTSEDKAAAERAETPERADDESRRPVTVRSFDRAQVARELASLGFDDDPPSRSTRPSSRPDGPAAVNGQSRAETSSAGDAVAAEPDRFGRDDDVTRGLLLRLIDGVKGA